MIEGGVQKESVKMIPEQVFVVPTEQVFAEKCQELIPDPSDTQKARVTLGLSPVTRHP